MEWIQTLFQASSTNNPQTLPTVLRQIDHIFDESQLRLFFDHLVDLISHYPDQPYVDYHLHTL